MNVPAVVAYVLAGVVLLPFLVRWHLAEGREEDKILAAAEAGLFGVVGAVLWPATVLICAYSAATRNTRD